jgi:broad specificity phosphatase PhoE
MYRPYCSVNSVSILFLVSPSQRLRLTKRNERLVIVLVGLPGRGKSFIARKLQNFLTWRGSECRVFNVGKYRRTAAAGACDANFFDSKNAAAARLRQEAASDALRDMLRWLDHEDGATSGGGASAASAKAPRKDRVGIYDATNSTKERRDWILTECTDNTFRAGKPTGVIFVESICDDEDLLHENYMTKVNNSPDYMGMDKEEAMADILKRAALYEEAYETIDDDSQSYIKMYNLSSKILVNHIYGRMAKSIVPALMAWNIGTRPVFICRAGETMDVLERHSMRCLMSRSESLGPIMSRSESLGPNGTTFRDALFDYMKSECLDFVHRRKMAGSFIPNLKTGTGTSINGAMNRGPVLRNSHGDLATLPSSQNEAQEEDVYIGIDGITPLPFPCYIMSSTMPRARQTVEWEGMPYSVQMVSNLNPLDKGDFTGIELEDIAEMHPEWYQQLVVDPFHTRFPGGECYGDLTSRLESVVVDIEQQVGPVLVVSHVSILQVLVAYFRGTPVERCTSIALPLNTVLKFTPSKGGGWQESQFRAIRSLSPSHCDLKSMDDGTYCHPPPEDHCKPYGTPQKVMFKDDSGDVSPPEDLVSPLPTPPIWGDHLRGALFKRHSGGPNIKTPPLIPNANLQYG